MRTACAGLVKRPQLLCALWSVAGVCGGQGYLGIPRAVGLDLAAAEVDVEQPLPALLVAEIGSLGSPALSSGAEGGAPEEGTRFLCLSADNR